MPKVTTGRFVLVASLMDFVYSFSFAQSRPARNDLSATRVP
jgi:hypothetical protein